MCYMTTHVQVNNNRTYSHIFIPTGIKTKFNTCEMHLIARSGLFQSLVTAVAFLHCNSHRVSITSILHPVDLIIRLKSSTGIFIFIYNTDMHLLSSRDPPTLFPISSQQLSAGTVTDIPCLLTKCSFWIMRVHSSKYTFHHLLHFDNKKEDSIKSILYA